MIKAGQKVSYRITLTKQRPTIKEEQAKDPNLGSWTNERQPDQVVKGKIGDLSNVLIPVVTREGDADMMLYKDLKPLQKDRVSYTAKLPDVIRIKKGTEGKTDEEETIKGRTVRRTAKLGNPVNLYLPVIAEDGTKKMVVYNKLKFLEVK